MIGLDLTIFSAIGRFCLGSRLLGAEPYTINNLDLRHFSEPIAGNQITSYFIRSTFYIVYDKVEENRQMQL